jgi:hypothetical protein
MKLAHRQEAMGLSEADTRAKFIYFARHVQGGRSISSGDEPFGAIEIIKSKPRKQTAIRVDYNMLVWTNPNTPSIAMALIEVKAADLPLSNARTTQALVLLEVLEYLPDISHVSE